MTVTDLAPDPLALREVFGSFPTGVTALAGLVNGRPLGLAASSFTSVSLAPPLVSVCVAHSSSSWPQLRNAGRLGISVLSEAQGPLARQLSGPAEQRFDGVGWRAGEFGSVLVDDATAWLECSIFQMVRAGDHDIIVLLVHELAAAEAAPLVFHGSRFTRLSAAEEPRF